MEMLGRFLQGGEGQYGVTRGLRFRRMHVEEERRVALNDDRPVVGHERSYYQEWARG
jgi:hypothetical protein